MERGNLRLWYTPGHINFNSPHDNDLNKIENEISEKDQRQKDKEESNKNNKGIIESINKNKINLLYKTSNQIIDKNIDIINSDSFIFIGKTFKK